MQARRVDLPGLHGHYSIDPSATLTATDEHRTYMLSHMQQLFRWPNFSGGKNHTTAHAFALVLLCLLALLYDLSLSTLLSNSVVRMGMNAIMVLAMVPGIQCGISLNLGLPIGLVAGLIGGLMTIEFGIPGWGGFLFAIAVGAAIAAVAGWLYGLLLNRLKGEEMSVTTYVGFSIVSVMCIAWLVLPFTSLKLRWPPATAFVSKWMPRSADSPRPGRVSPPPKVARPMDARPSASSRNAAPRGLPP